MEEGNYYGFKFDTKGLSSNVVKTITHNYTSGYELFEDGTLEFEKETNGVVFVRFFIRDRQEVTDHPRTTLSDVFKQVQNELNRLSKLKADLDLLGIKIK